MEEIGNLCFVFTKFDQLPSALEASSIEWRTLDLLNNFHYSHTPVSDEIHDLRIAFEKKIVNMTLLCGLAERFGNDQAREVIHAALQMLQQTNTSWTEREARAAPKGHGTSYT